jgi:hypothetical protein
MPNRRTTDARQMNVSPEAHTSSKIADAGADSSAQSDSNKFLITEKNWNRLRHNGRLVHGEVSHGLLPIARPLAWEKFQQIPIARLACSLMQLLEPQHAGAGLYRRRARRPAGAGFFDDIASLVHREKAEKIYADLCDRHAERLPWSPWLLPILAGRARDLALRPDAHGSEQGRRMRRIKGGKHTQRRYRELGWHPLASVRKAWGLTGERPQE